MKTEDDLVKKLKTTDKKIELKRGKMEFVNTLLRHFPPDVGGVAFRYSNVTAMVACLWQLVQYEQLSHIPP